MDKSRRRLIVFLLAVAAAIGLFAWGALSSREPQYQGRPISAWLADLLCPPESASYLAAAEAIRSLGTNALTPCLYRLQAADPALSRVFSSWVRLPLLRNYFTPAVLKRKQALEALRVLGPVAAPGIPVLVALLSKPRCAMEATFALTLIGPKAIAPLVDALQHTNPTVRAIAASGLGNLTSAPNVVPPLVACLGDPNPFVRAGAAKSLGQICADPQIAIPALVVSLRDPDIQTRSYAAEALGNFGKQAAFARGALTERLSDPDLGVQNVARSALDKIGP
jgi:hypothetical protein